MTSTLAAALSRLPLHTRVLLHCCNTATLRHLVVQMRSVICRMRRYLQLCPPSAQADRLRSRHPSHHQPCKQEQIFFTATSGNLNQMVLLCVWSIWPFPVLFAGVAVVVVVVVGRLVVVFHRALCQPSAHQYRHSSSSYWALHCWAAGVHQPTSNTSDW